MIGDEGAKYLAASTALSGLTQLNVAGNRLTPAGDTALQRSTTLVNMKTLEIV